MHNHIKLKLHTHTHINFIFVIYNNFSYITTVLYTLCF